MFTNILNDVKINKNRSYVWNAAISYEIDQKNLLQKNHGFFLLSSELWLWDHIFLQKQEGTAGYTSND